MAKSRYSLDLDGPTEEALSGIIEHYRTKIGTDCPAETIAALMVMGIVSYNTDPSFLEAVIRGRVDRRRAPRVAKQPKKASQTTKQKATRTKKSSGQPTKTGVSSTHVDDIEVATQEKT